MSRFDYVAYDEKAVRDQAAFKNVATTIESMIEGAITSPRAKALALTKLEECYMWIGKGVRDDQIARLGAANVKLQEERSNS
jgi:hypothetical protein